MRCQPPVLLGSLRLVDDADGVPQGGPQPPDRVCKTYTLYDILRKVSFRV